MTWSIDAFCQHQHPVDLSRFPPSTSDFTLKLGLPSIHPFCREDDFQLEGIPPMGGLLTERFHGQTYWEMIVSMWKMVIPPLVAMAELWLRLFAGAVGPMGVAFLTFLNVGFVPQKFFATSKRQKYSQSLLSAVVALTVASCSVLMTDTLYVLENGHILGAFYFLAAVSFGTQTCVRHDLPHAAVIVFALGRRRSRVWK
jgi:hypothetical protein